MIEITRLHEICMGHRVYGHESKCSNLHGHNYKFEFFVRPKEDLDKIGRVTDFSEVKTVLCAWLEENWDHKFLLWYQDPLYQAFDYWQATDGSMELTGIVKADFNPTAENIARYFLTEVAPQLTENRSWYLHALNIFETSKCSAKAEYDVVPVYVKELRGNLPRGYYCGKQTGECECKLKLRNDQLHCENCLVDLPF